MRLVAAAGGAIFPPLLPPASAPAPPARSRTGAAPVHRARERLRAVPMNALLLLLAIATPIHAQDVGEKLRDDFRRLRANVVGVVEAMPREGIRAAPTGGVRDFAEQIEHIAAGAVGIIRTGLDSDHIDVGMERDVYLNDPDSLAAFVHAAFDRIDALLAGMDEEVLTTPGSLFGQLERPRWMIVQAAYEHGVWTLGATVPYLRMNGAAPPGYNLVPAVGRPENGGKS